MLTQAQLKERLHYDPETGIFTWLIPKRNSVKTGSIAGTKDRYGYIQIQLQHKRYGAHRLAWLYVHGRFPDSQIDHINRVKADNKICNLREVTHQQNQFNRDVNKNNTSGYIGVTMKGKKYRARITVEGKRTYLGLFDTAEKAGQAYLAAKSIYHVI